MITQRQREAFYQYAKRMLLQTQGLVITVMRKPSGYEAWRGNIQDRLDDVTLSRVELIELLRELEGPIMGQKPSHTEAINHALDSVVMMLEQAWTVQEQRKNGAISARSYSVVLKRDYQQRGLRQAIEIVKLLRSGG